MPKTKEYHQDKLISDTGFLFWIKKAWIAELSLYH